MATQPTKEVLITLRQMLARQISHENRVKIGGFIRNIAEKTPLGTTVLGNLYLHDAADAYLISFPKCGRTWLRLMIGKALQQQFNLSSPNIEQETLELTPLAKYDPKIPKVAIAHEDNPHWKKPEELQTDKSQYKNVKVIFLVRDPRDVVVSLYFEQKKRSNFWKEANLYNLKEYQDRIKPYEGSLSEFIYEPIGSLNTLIEYYNIWDKNRLIPESFLVVCYEDLHKNPHAELMKVLEFLGVTYRDEVIDEAVASTSFDKMRQREKSNADNPMLKPANVKDEESYKTRKGKVGNFTEYLNEAEIAYINQVIAEKLSDFYQY